MTPAIVVVFGRWGGLENPVRDIGIESGAWQSISVWWLQNGGIYRDFERRIKGVPPGQINKQIRMFNNVLTPLMRGNLWLDPDDTDTSTCMLDYDGTKANPSDGAMDALGIAVFIHDIPVANPGEGYHELLEAQRMAEQAVDPETGIDLSDLFDSEYDLDVMGDFREDDSVISFEDVN